ncbi:MAG: ATP-binding protein [Desulfosalsimonadaceae bacterium]
MKSIHFRTRLLFAFWLILIPALCIPAYNIFQTLEDEIMAEARENALQQLELGSWLIRQKAPFADPRAMDVWISRLGEKLNHRITLVGAKGNVLADSAVAYPQVPDMETHIYREEIMDARKKGIGRSVRYSTTVERKMIYAAKPMEMAGHAGAILRVAVPVSSIETRLDFYAGRFWLPLAAIFVLTLAVSFFLARRLETPINRIIRATREIGEGNFSKRPEIFRSPEFAELSACINQMADRIQQNIEMITAQKQELEAVLEGMQEGVLVLDNTGHIRSINPALKKIVRSGAACIGQRPMEVFLNPEIQNVCDEILSGGQPENRRVTIDADSIYEVNPVRIPDGGAVVVFHDISELVRLEKVRRDFVANISHELRTPLTSIKGYAETLMDREMRASREAEGFVRTILKNANQMTNIVNDLLELTSQQQKQQQQGLPELAPVDAARCFSAAWETCMPMAEKKGIQVFNQLSAPLPVQGETGTITRIFSNLLDNAIRHSPEGTAVRVFTLDKNDHLLFALRDEGPGIPKRHQKRIFERFYRVDKERSRASGGTGLGLAICRHAVQSMGGRIRVESPPDGHSRGTVFYFTLQKPAEKNGQTQPPPEGSANDRAE